MSEWGGPWICNTCGDEFGPCTFADGIEPTHVIENPNGPGFVTCGILHRYDRRAPDAEMEKLLAQYAEDRHGENFYMAVTNLMEKRRKE